VQDTMMSDFLQISFVYSVGVLLFDENTVHHCLINSSTNGLPTKLLCHMTVIIFHLRLYKSYSFSIFITAFGVAGTKSIKSIDDSQFNIHHIQSISLFGAIVDNICALYFLSSFGNGS
jgi:hypothetical protein